MERRKLYLTFGYSSLFEYLTKSIGYSNGSAQRRIDVARLSFDAPEVIDKIESGELNLAQVSLLQKSIRDIQVSTKTKIKSEMKENLIEQLSNKSFAESEVIVAKALNIQPKEYVKTKHQKDESVRLEITFTKVQWQILVRMREIVSNSLPNGSSNWDQVLEYVASHVIQQKNKSRLVKKRVSVEKTEAGLSTNRTGEPKQLQREMDSLSILNKEQPSIPARKPISLPIQRKVFQRDQCCQYLDKQTGKQCQSQWRLAIDHVQPIWAGGNNNPENLRILCRAHNQELYRQQAHISQCLVESRLKNPAQYNPETSGSQRYSSTAVSKD